MSRPFIPVPNVCSVELIYTVGGFVMENVLHVQGGTPFDLDGLKAVRGLVDSWDNTSWKNLRSTSVYLSRIRTKALDDLGSPTEDYALPSPRQGGLTNAPTALNATFAIKLSTGLTGRSYRGRLYLPGLVAPDITNGVTLLQARADAAVTSLNLLISTLIAHSPSWKLCVVSYMTNHNWRATGVATSISNAVYTDLNVDSQRRRLAGRGRT